MTHAVLKSYCVFLIPQSTAGQRQISGMLSDRRDLIPLAMSLNADEAGMCRGTRQLTSTLQTSRCSP